MTPSFGHVFPSFSNRHSQFEKLGEISQESITLFHEKASPGLLPDMLIEFWEEYGIGRFSNGFLYLCDPVAKKTILNFFFPNQEVYPLVITSFGDIFFTDLKKIYILRSIYGTFKRIASNTEVIFEGSLQDLEYLNEGLNLPFHSAAIQKFGGLEPDQIFGFEPAIAFGGNDEDINSVKKFQMDAHLAFLSQLVQIEEL
jgi:hypothetical protein